MYSTNTHHCYGNVAVPSGLRPGGVFSKDTAVVRTTFLIDGFNLYHSLRNAESDTGIHPMRWLDLRSLCNDYLYIIGQHTHEMAILETIHFFSATPTHYAKETQDRHSLYMRCLASTGIKMHLGRFKRKDLRCSICNGKLSRYEEKETDVAIATELFSICHTDAADTIVLVTGDTDLAPTVRVCKRLFPSKLICFAFPYKRYNAELAHIAIESFKISTQKYISNQFPDPLLLPDGSSVSKPANW